jgi:competence protein ComEC
MANAGMAVLLGWVLGVALQLQQATLNAAWLYGGALGLGLLAGWGALRWRPGRLRWAALLLGAVGLGWGLTGWRAAAFADQALAADLEGRDTVVVGRVATLPQRGADSQRFVFEVASATQSQGPVDLPSRLQIAWYQRGDSVASVDPIERPRAGERWRLTVRLRQPHGAFNPHGFDRERWWWEQGIGAVGYVRDGANDPPSTRLRGAPFYRVDRWREAVSERIAARVSDARLAGVLAALVVGDQSAIERDDWTLFRTTGVAHLVSISGLHVTLFAWLAVLGLGALGRRWARHWPGLALWLPVQQSAAVGGLALAVAYAVFAGWGVPAQRTVLMLALFVGLRMLGRQWPWPVVWSAALAAVLLLDPWAWLQAGFWLSFVAVGILFSALPAARDAPPARDASARVQRLGRSAVGLLREQAVVTMALAPLSLLLFGQISVVGLVANLLAIPWVTLVLTPLALAGVAWPWLWDVAALAVQALLAWLGWLAQWPWAALYRPVPPLWMGVLAALGALVLVLRLPWVWRWSGVLLLWPVWAWTPPRPPPAEFEVLALDVGQGSALLVRTATHSLLFDTGPRYGPGTDAGQSIVVPVLRAMGERPDTVVVSHRDSDHAGGSGAVRAAWPQARWLSSFDTERNSRCLAGQAWRWDGVAFEMLHPSPEHFDEQGKGRLSSNAMSCTLRVSNGATAAWLSGDLDADRETRLALARPALRADLLVAPHHGSRTSSSPVLLNVLRPSWVLVQSGYRNRFGHPAPEILARYQARGMQWVNSPDCGAATWRSMSPDKVYCHRLVQPRYWRHAAEKAVASPPPTEGSAKWTLKK